MTHPMNPAGYPAPPPAPPQWAGAGVFTPGQQSGQGPVLPPAPSGPPPINPPNPGKGGGRWGKLIVAAAIVAAAVLGGIAGGLIVDRSSTPSEGTVSGGLPAPAPSAETVHAQDIRLCTAYAIINSAMPKPDDSPADILLGVAALENALDANLDASVEIREALNSVIDAFYARMASYPPVRGRGLVDPPPYDMELAQRSYDRAWSVCQLDG